MSDYRRGDLVRVTNPAAGATHYAVVSNDIRNEVTPTLIGVPLYPGAVSVPTAVALAAGDPLNGHLLADFPTVLTGAEIETRAGALTPATLDALAKALRIAIP